MAIGKVIVIAISVILVVGVLVGTIVGVTHKTQNKDELSTSSKAVAAICGPTDYKEACVKSLGPLANDKNVTPKKLIQAAIESTINQVKSGLEKSSYIAKSTNNATQKMSMDDCQELLHFAIDELQASLTMVGDNELHTVNNKVSELKNWLTAVISYQQSCLDGITHPDMYKDMSNGLLNATELTSNALAIVSAMSTILTSFKIPVNTSASSRKLLEATEERVRVGSGKYPKWFPPADRKLLAKHREGALPPNAVVAKDGSGQFKTIGEALAAYPKNLQGRYVIYVKAGKYDEYITVTKNQINVFMYGDGSRKTLVTGSKSFAGGVSTMQTATFAAVGNGFIAKSIGFQNTAGPQGHQAVALRVQSDMSAFFNCRMDGYQDTLYTQAHRQFYRNCVISGTVDFIFGDAPVVIQNTLIIIRRPMEGQKNAVTAQGRSDKREISGIVIQNCRIVPEVKLEPVKLQIPSYLGRPWKMYSRTVIMESLIGDLINPAGWLEWDKNNFALDTLYYGEYANRGPGASTDRRVKWKGYKVITDRNEALQFTAGAFLQGDMWLRFIGAPHYLGFKV